VSSDRTPHNLRRHPSSSGTPWTWLQHAHLRRFFGSTVDPTLSCRSPSATLASARILHHPPCRRPFPVHSPMVTAQMLDAQFPQASSRSRNRLRPSYLRTYLSIGHRLLCPRAGTSYMLPFLHRALSPSARSSSSKSSRIPLASLFPPLHLPPQPHHQDHLHHLPPHLPHPRTHLLHPSSPSPVPHLPSTKAQSQAAWSGV
jgi:hypothetical protein